MPETTRAQDRTRDIVGWLVAPATDAAPGYQAVGTGLLRILLGLMWLYNVSWKHAPDFGKDSGTGLYKFTSYAVSDPVFQPFSWVVEHVVLKAFTPFGWMVLVLETLLAVLLLSGAFVRVAAVLGIAQSAAIALSVAHGPGEWPWSYWLMIGAHLAVLVTASGRFLAVDGVRAGVTDPSRLASFWSPLAGTVGIIALIGSFSDPLDSGGFGVTWKSNSLSLGSYNLLGALTLIVIAVLVFFGATGRRQAYVGAAVLGVAAALALYVQLGFSDPFLGGTTVSAAFFLTLALVAGCLARQSPPAGDRRYLGAGTP